MRIVMPSLAKESSAGSASSQALSSSDKVDAHQWEASNCPSSPSGMCRWLSSLPLMTYAPGRLRMMPITSLAQGALIQ